MLSFAIYLQLLSLYIFFSNYAATVAPTAYTPTDYTLIDCGASSPTKSDDQRTWVGDSEPSKFSPTKNTSFTSPASSVFQVPYITARIFQTRSSYALPVSPGSKFLRLYFYPAQYSGLDISTSFFSVSVNNYTLLKNFSAYLTASAMSPPSSFFMKEFILPVGENEMLNITFIPSPNSFAFANGIEVVSIPEGLYTADKTEKSIPFVPNKVDFNLDKSIAFETAYRLNVGGREVSNTEDTGMFRTWRDDTDYIYGQTYGTLPYLPKAVIKYTEETPPYTAPDIVYKTSRTMGTAALINLNYNLTWNFAIDSGFNYLVRLHFCETQMEFTHKGQRVFYIYINNQTAENDADVIYWSGGNSVPVYRDYVVWVSGRDQSAQVILWLALYPDADAHPNNADAILNGAEIFKLSDSKGSLAGRNPEPDVPSTPMQPYGNSAKKKKGKASSMVMAIPIAAVSSVFVLFLCAIFLIYKRKRRVKDSAPNPSHAKSSWAPLSYTGTATSTHTAVTTASLLPSDLCRRFSIAEIKEATSDFDDQFIVGSGGFGNVYRGSIDGGTTTVAIKRLNRSSGQGAREFETELELLSKLRHVNLVSLIGYCDDHGEMILVYEYVSRGSLRDHLYKTKNPPLPWKLRLQICIGAARGLHYLHREAKHCIIHRDVKSTNILLDENWVAKVSDFGLSRVGPKSTFETHVSTVVKGSVGYVDPEYYRRQQLTEKSDVYSFGVLLFEVLCARPPLLRGRGVPKEEVSLAFWAKICYESGTLDKIMDPHLMGDIEPMSLKKFGEVAISCLHDRGIERPAISDVLWGLQSALQLQEATEKNVRRKGGTDGGLRGETIITDDDDDLFSVSSGFVSGSGSTISEGARSFVQPQRSISKDLQI